jgi:hypothetical protein
MFYKYWKQNIEKEITNPTKIIKKIINIYNENIYIDKMPHFILKFFERIEFEIDTSNNVEKKNILEKYYNDKEYFLDKINKLIENSLNEYLGIEEENE